LIKTKKILVGIIHVPGKDDENFELLKTQLSSFDIYVPRVGFYGNRIKEIRAYFEENDYYSLFLICSDVRIVCGNIVDKIEEYANDSSIGCYGFGTINNCTFPWLKYDNINLTKTVPFVEGYCFGANKALIKQLELENIYGYGMDVEMGYRSHASELKCIISNDVCISHAYGKSYDDSEATKEYQNFLISNPDIHTFLKNRSVYTSI
jgi:hypothetical protein